MHFFMNTYVMISLGGFLESIIGARRLLILWTLSAVAGSVASAFSGDRISVGASGALWGILGAQAMLAFRPRGLLPEVLIPDAKRNALTNLGLNVMITFMIPNIDAAAHFGGGAMGALLVFTGLITAGMARKKKQIAFTDDPLEADRPPFWVTPAALACAALLITALALAFNTGKPWAQGTPWQD